ncbi:unnamed protein product [Acanthoscelides obtectus]|uniref:Uncharacterized protein n=1 Tax=Acanthoscelides obtectus TaxID=200917 RepID=A0A9P0K198_ACAOB|nr:unnamed protein product [Acanthoscelides obtectus]CAK1669685.1 hypothetical protein AOBTE_LOCUS27170 [Acanthoscelides obtectus]
MSLNQFSKESVNQSNGKLLKLKKVEIIKSNEEDINKKKKGKIWRVLKKVQRNHKTYRVYRCGWCKSFLSKNATQCIMCLTHKQGKIHFKCGIGARKQQIKSRNKKQIDKDVKTDKLWRISCAYRYKDDKVIYKDKCGWCHSFLAKDAKQGHVCLIRKEKRENVTTNRSFLKKKSVSKTAKSHSTSDSVVKDVTNPYQKSSTGKSSMRQDSSANILEIGNLNKDPAKKSEPKCKLRKSAVKKDSQIKVSYYTSRTGNIIKMYKCSKCSRFLKNNSKKCTRCSDLLRRRLTHPKISSEKSKMIAETKKNKLVLKSIQPIGEEGPNDAIFKYVAKLCRICKRIVKKPEEEYCYKCREKSRYERILKAMKAEKSNEDDAGTNTSDAVGHGSPAENEASRSNEAKKVVKLCSICKRIVKKPHEDYCYKCRERSEYKDILRALKANKELRQANDPSTIPANDDKFEFVNVEAPSTENGRENVLDENSQSLGSSANRKGENEVTYNEYEEDETNYISLKDIELLTGE